MSQNISFLFSSFDLSFQASLVIGQMYHITNQHHRVCFFISFNSTNVKTIKLLGFCKHFRRVIDNLINKMSSTHWRVWKGWGAEHSIADENGNWGDFAAQAVCGWWGGWLDQLGWKRRRQTLSIISRQQRGFSPRAFQLVLYNCGFEVPPSENKAFAKLALKQSNQYYSNTMFRKNRITRQEAELHTKRLPLMSS